MRKKILIFGHYGVPNWGDESILLGILSQIDVSKYSITVVSHDPDHTRAQYGVKAVVPPPFGVRSFFRFSWIKTLRHIKSSDIIIFGGGGLFQPSPRIALKIWDWYLRICVFFQKRIFFIGQSFGNIAHANVPASAKKRMNHVSFFSVRDEFSAKILKEQWGIHPSKIFVSTDAVFFHPSLERKDKVSQVLFAFREGDLSAPQELKILEAVRNQFPNHTFRFLVMQSFQSEDEKFAKRNSMECIFPQSVDEVFEHVSSADFVVSTRFHGAAIASVCHTPFLAIACREKIARFFGDNFSVFPDILLEENSEAYLEKKISEMVKNVKDMHDFNDHQYKKLEFFFPRILTY